MIQLKRAYEPASPDDGRRYLVERLWPRGVKKEALRIEAWLTNVAPSDALRRWFAHDAKKWAAFHRRYFNELDKSGAAWKPLFEAACCGTVTLVYSACDTQHNNAVALKAYLEMRISKARAPMRG